ncbi:MAG TPA: hypothetical protein VNS08_07095 [Ureibacillus sp.]|nr:hypothetical protein [Ureibacillus sp.]
MRATRVLSTQNSTFRNSRQYLHSNEQVFRVMQEGELHQFSGGRGNRQRKKQQEKKNSSRKRILKTQSKSLYVAGMNFDVVSIASLQNNLLKHSREISIARKTVNRLRAYRSSI